MRRPRAQQLRSGDEHNLFPFHMIQYNRRIGERLLPAGAPALGLRSRAAAAGLGADERDEKEFEI